MIRVSLTLSRAGLALPLAQAFLLGLMEFRMPVRIRFDSIILERAYVTGRMFAERHLRDN